MNELNNLESLQKLKLKLDVVKRIVEDRSDQFSGVFRLHYMTIYYAIIGSIKTTNNTNLKHTKQSHNNRYRRKMIRIEREEDREWLMSDGAESMWSAITNEDWGPVREQIQQLWHDINSLARPLGPKGWSKISRAVSRQLSEVSV